MIGQWDIGDVKDMAEFRMCLAHLRETGCDQAVLFIGFKAYVPPKPTHSTPNDSHMMYWLVCQDPGGEWYWLNDPDDTGWSDVKLNPVDTLPVIGHHIGLMVAR